MKINNTPFEVIIALENSYSSKDLDTIIEIKDFITEAELMIKNNSLPFSVIFQI